MTEQKKSDGKRTSKRIKASTGAWWKTLVEDEPQPPVAPEAEKKEERSSMGQAVVPESRTEEPAAEQDAAAARPATKSAPAEQVEKSRPRRSPRKKKAEPDTTGEVEPAAAAEAVTAPAEPSAEGQSTAPAPAKPARKRSPRKKKAAADQAPQVVAGVPVKSEGIDLVAVSAVVTVAGGAAGEKETEAAGGVRAGEAIKAGAGRTRAPRGNRGAAEQETGKAPVVEPEADTVVESVTGEGQPEPAKVEETEAEKPKKSGRKRSPRKKKSAAAEQPIQEQTSVEAAVAAELPEAAPAEEVSGETAEGQPEEQREPRKKSGQRRSRGRRGRGRQARQAEAEGREQDAAGKDALPEAETQPAEELAEKGDQEDFEADVDLESEDFDEAEVEDLPEDEERGELVLKLLINAEEPEECRLALLENGRLESIHVSTINRTQTKNNIYKGKIVAIEPNLQAAFVDYGTEKNGFLPFSEIHPEYYKQDLPKEIQQLVDAHHWKRLSITDVVEKGQEVMVQVVKEEVGKKGANMTTYLSLPGRSVVLMPGSDSSGISRKISGEERRNQLRKVMNGLDIPEGIGWIVRTASADITKTALSRDVGYLLRLWEEIKKKAQSLDGVGQVYEDHQSVLRFLREHFDPAIEEILVDDKDAMEQVKEFISLLPSAQRDVKVRMHKGSRPIFNQFSVEDQIESIYQPRVNLPSGGSIVIEPTEALVSIDVNSGSTSKGKNFDQSIYQANLEAASELARQLRLRDLGGLIVVDFIDMRNKKHIRDVERQLKQAMRRDKAKVDFSRISKFGLMQISRQKLGSPIEAGNYRVCTHCKGRGTVRSVETLALFYLRRIQTGASRKHVARVECHFPLDVAQYLLNNKRHEIHEHETRYNTEISIIPEPSMSPVENEILLLKSEKEVEGKKQA